MERLIKKFQVAPEVLKTDTIFKVRHDTFLIPEIKFDTMVKYFIDSIKVITKDGIRTEIKIMKDTFYLQTTVFKRDTIIELRDTVITIEKIITVDTTKVKAPWVTKLLGGVVYSLIIIVLLLISYLLYKKYIR